MTPYAVGKLWHVATFVTLGFAAAATQAASAGPRAAEQSRFDPVATQQMHELVCAQQAERDMAKPVTLPPGTVRAWEFERTQRVKLCLMKAAQGDEAAVAPP
jgi:hypothetical protein